MTNTDTSLFSRAGALGVAAFMLTPLAAAQGLQSVYGPDNVVPPDPDVTLPTSYSAAVAGDLFANCERAIVALDRGVLRVKFDPAVFDSTGVVDSATDYTGLTSLPQPDGEGDPLIAANASGLVRIDPDLANGGYLPSVPLVGAPWASATMLESATIGGMRHIVGVSAGGTSLLAAEHQPTGWVHAFTIALPLPALDIAVADLDGDGDDELFVIDEDYLRGYRADGTLMMMLPSRGDTTAGLARVRTSDGEHMAWITRSSAGLPWLRIVRANGAELPITLSLPIVPGGVAQDMDPTAIAAADVDGDGEEDVVILDGGSCRGGYFVNQGNPTAHFSANTLGTDYALLHYGADPAAPPVGGTGGLSMADFGGDDLADVVVANGGTGEAWTYLTEEGFGGTEQSVAAYDFVAANTTWYGDEGLLNLAFELTPQIIADATHIEAISYFYDHTMGDDQSGAHKAYQRFEIVNPSIFQWIPFELDETTTATHADVWTGEEWIYLVRFRWVKVDSNGTVIRSSASRLGAMSLRSGDIQGQAPDMCVDVSWLVNSFSSCSTWFNEGFSLNGQMAPVPSNQSNGSSTYLGGWIADIDPPRFLETPTVPPSNAGGNDTAGTY